MNINQRIEKALQEITPCIWPSVCPEESAPAEYIVYNPELEEAVLYGDNEDQEWAQYMQVHLFSKGNYMKKRRLIRIALREAGMPVSEIETLYEKDTGYYHLIFSCAAEEETEES